jgi:hypothetical protein
MTRRTRATALVVLFTLSGACTLPAQSGWITLFNGKNTSAWRGYLKSDFPAGWQIVDGALTRAGPATDIITKEKFENFDLRFEWKVAKGSNSGVFFNVVEDTALHHAYDSAPEYQILDNRNHRDGLNPITSAGSNFALHAPVSDVTKAVGQWNRARIVVNKGHVEHWLNGVKLLDYYLWSGDWNQRVAASKFKDFPAYGKSRSGHIGLQDHGDWVAFRNIKIRRIK